MSLGTKAANSQFRLNDVVQGQPILYRTAMNTWLINFEIGNISEKIRINTIIQTVTGLSLNSNSVCLFMIFTQWLKHNFVLATYGL